MVSEDHPAGIDSFCSSYAVVDDGQTIATKSQIDSMVVLTDLFGTVSCLGCCGKFSSVLHAQDPSRFQERPHLYLHPHPPPPHLVMGATDILL